ncbi:MAG TPA: sensor histidine kinase, partial [Steroidobacteraceae bacterium]|nr:sensor histidine kinase [Steroidobacteraceae bacterium]
MRLTRGQYLAGYRLTSPPPASVPGVAVRLPLSLGYSPPSRATAPQWVRCEFRLARTRSRERVIYLPYVAPNAAVYLDGLYIGRSEGFGEAQTDSWNFPLYLRVPPVLLHPGAHQLLIELAPNPGAYTELGPVWVGTNGALLPLYRRQEWLQVTGVEVVTLLVGMIGAFATLLWVRRNRDIVFGLFALSCGIWMVRNAQFFVVRTHSLFYFTVITNAALFWLVAVLYRLSFRVLGKAFPRFERAMFGFALLITVGMYLAGPGHQFVWSAAGYGALLPIGIGFQAYLTWATLRSPTVLRQLLWLAALVTSLSGAYDLALMLEWIPWPGSYLMPYSSLFYAGAVGWALADSFVRTHNEYEALNVALDTRVRERESALRAQYDRSAALERGQAVAAERDRILRDMHDGLGLQLLIARRLIEKAADPPQQVAATLDDAIDELRIAIDSMKPTAHDLLVMLGNLRYRLEPRLKAAGISLHWNVADAPDALHLGPREITEITRIVQEICSNAIKHSGATDMSLSVHCPRPDSVGITIADNGCGFDVAAARHGEGLASMERRARSIGARLEIDSRAAGTRIAITLPELRPPPAP